MRGLRLQADGPAPDAYASLCLARASLAADPVPALAATVAAVGAAWTAGDHPACVEALTAALSRPGAPDGPREEYLAGMLALLVERPGDAAPLLAGVVEQVRATSDGESLLIGVAAALLAGDVGSACHTGARALAAARADGDEAMVARATEYVAYAELRAGRHALAREHASRGLRAALRTGRANTAAHHHAVLALTASVQGTSAEVREHAHAALATARRHGLAQPVTLAEWALGRAELAQGRAAEAAARIGSLLADPDGGAHFALRGLVLPLLVEAAMLAGDDATARAAIPELTRWSRSAADPHGPALELRCRALVASADAEADDLYRRAHAAHQQVGGGFETARTLLLHGMWLRRHRRPGDARDRLRDALRLLERCGAEPWARGARTELRAAGAVQDAPAPDAVGSLTPHQLRVARCVAAGDTNREIAERLAVSVRTVDCHLRNIFVALQVRSRVELTRLLPPEHDPPST